jgi:hypothetical protein
MATTSTDTYDMVGIREDLSNFIYNVDKTKTFFLSNAPTTKAKGTKHDWQTDTFAAVTDNKTVQGADAVFTASAATTRLDNYTQIAQETVAISGTMDVADTAGRANEMNYQIMKAGTKLKRDMEHSFVGLNKAKAVGSATVPAESASMQSYISTNTSFGATGVDPTGDGSDARTDGTQRVFTEALLEGVLDSIFNNTGEAPDCMLLGSFNKRALNAFTGHATSTDHMAEAQSIINAVDVYKSDYGITKVIPSTYSRSRDALLYKKDMWAVAFHRQMKASDIAKIGDAERKQVVVEYTLEARNEASSGIIADLTTA